MSILRIFHLNALCNLGFVEEAILMLKINAIASLVIILMGTVDWLTTMIGIGYYHAFEANPVLAGVANTNLSAFTVIKLAATVMIGLAFYFADTSLSQTKNKFTMPFKVTNIGLKSAYVGVAALLLVTVCNNLIVLAQVV
jgi:hypothetical protein